MAQNIITFSDDSERTLNKIKGIALMGGRIIRTKTDSANVALEMLEKAIKNELINEYQLAQLLKK